MKKNNIVKEYFINNAVKYIICTFVFVAGVCIGSGAYRFMDISDAKELVRYFSDNVSQSKSATFISVVKNSLWINLKYIMVYFFMAMTVYTARLAVAAVGVKGFCVGFTSAFLIANYASNGIAYVILAIVPSAVLMLPAYVTASTVAVEFAADRRRKRATGIRAAVCIIPFLCIVYGIMAISSVYEGIVSPLIFRKLF